MSVENVLSRLAQSLLGWSKAGLNEAQTSQVIVLPTLRALGYDIWNPDEIAAQIHSGGGNAAYAPDFTVKLGGNICFILEIKALNKEFSHNDTVQAVNYANALGRRWAVLTNGKAWHFYDNQVSKPAADKLVLTVELKDPRAAAYLERLLSRSVWSVENAESSLVGEVQATSAEIRRHLKLSEIETKLRGELREGFTKDEKGLKKAMQLTLEPNERELAEASFTELAKHLLGIDAAPVTPEPESEPEKTAEQYVLAAITDGMRVTTSNTRSKHVWELRAWLGEVELPVKNWRDINAGIVEVMILLGRRDFVSSRGYVSPSDQRAKSDGSLYPKHAHRKLSDGSFLFLHTSANSHLQQSRKMLKELGVPPKTLHITYRDKTFYLP